MDVRRQRARDDAGHPVIVYDAAPYGFVVPKDQTELADAIAEALAAMKEDGSYEQALKNWGNEAGAIDEFAVNP